MESASLEFSTHSLRERVVVNLIAKSLRRMEAEGASLASQISAAPAGPGKGGSVESPRSSAPLPGGSGSRLDTRV